MRRWARAAAGVAALLEGFLCLGLAFAAASPQKSIHDGVFTADQVKAGKEVFRNICSECHATDAFGPDYMEAWSGASVGELFQQIQATMPYESPGILEDKQYADVIVYLFNINGVAAGDQEMTTDLAELSQINIAGPFKWNGGEN